MASVGAGQAIVEETTTSGLGGNAPSVGTGSWSVVSGGEGTFNPNASTPDASFTHAAGVGPVLVRWTISNLPCTVSSADLEITILPADTTGPVASNIFLTPNPSPVFSPLVLTATVSEVSTGGSGIAWAQYRFDGGPWLSMNASDAVFDSPTEVVTATMPEFSTAGVHTVCVQGSDARGNIGPEDCLLLAVYDPNGGFVTGGGWITSPAGAYAASPAVTGKANFGFVSKYLPGSTVPSGNTEFQFQAARFSFKSVSYEWLVVSGPKAQYKGFGTVNGAGNYAFILTATDGDVSGGHGIDQFRLKVYDHNQGNAVIYDNQLGAPDNADPTTALGGGSIVIHK